MYHHGLKRGSTESIKIPLKYHNDKVLMSLQRQKENSSNIDIGFRCHIEITPTRICICLN